MRVIGTLSALALLLASAGAGATDLNFRTVLTNPYQYYQMSYNNPYECDARTSAGAEVWNPYSQFAAWHGSAAGVYFFNGGIVRGQEGVQISFEPALSMASGASNIAESVPGSNAGSRTVDGVPLYIKTDIDIRVNRDKWAAKRFYCDQTATIGTTQLYFDRVMAHEMGHVVGLDERSTGTDCLMYYGSIDRAALKQPCPAEAGLPARLYGAY